MCCQKLFLRILIYAIGLLCLAFGVAFGINAKLGIPPVNSIPYVLSLVTKVDMGICIILIFSGYILLQYIILRKNFKWINLTQLVFSSLFGYFVDFARHVLGGFEIPTYAGKLAMLAISIVLYAIGVSMYVDTKLVNMPMEGLVAAITSVLPGKSFQQVKVVLDCTVVFVAAALSLLAMGGLHGVREGTALCALLVGPLMQPAQRILNPVINKICFERKKGDAQNPAA
ncbi:MAG: DUF6198 family protein [Acidaminococcales bacterium]|nr:DUF6198 family protein [Acidaminococcales bacterium]